MALYEFLRPLTRIAYALKLGESASLPKPRDEPSVLSDDSAADRVLLIGNAPCHGWGVVSHQLALTGQLSRMLRASTGRPTSVHFIGNESMTMASARAWLGTHDVSQYDVVLLAIGTNDAVRLTRVTEWERTLRELLVALSAGMRPNARLVVAGIQPVRSIPAYDNIVGGVAEVHARRLNTITEHLAGVVDRASYFRLPTPAFEKGRPEGSAQLYRSWAGAIAEVVAPVLDATRADGLCREPFVEAETVWEWSGTPRVIEAASTGGTPELQRLAALAENEFGVDLAVVSILQGDRQWYAMNTELLPASIPRELGYCETTIDQGSMLVVPDARRDPRFSTNPLIDVSHLLFYAGYPLQSRSGEFIATFCLLNSRPRSESSVSESKLREIAMQAQNELWRIEAEELAASAAPAA